ncbi:MAG TPA: tetratricopeptide repeat protein [Thermoanaerobaculia bacterium]|nr:tetratricopeptide repeat protein [Thermoanaerobaculia bacterium]
MRRITSWTLAAVVALGGAGLAEAGWEEGVAAFKANNFQAAATEFAAVVEKQPEFAGGQYMLGIALLKLDRAQDALTNLRKAYELEPANRTYQLALGQAYLAAERFADAAQMLQKIDPAALPKQQQDEYHQMLAVALSRSGNSEAALGALKKLTETEPNNSDAWYRYGTAAFNAGDTAAGVAALEKAVALDGANVTKKEALAKALLRQARETQGDRKQAVYEKAVRVASELATASASYENTLLLGELQLGAGKYAEAVATLKKAAAANGAQWFPHFYMSQAQTLLGDYTAAEASAQAALELAPSAKEEQMVWKQIGFAREKQRDYEGAKEAYRKGGDTQSVARVEQNEQIAGENQQIEQENQRIEEMEAERRRLEEELRELGGPPRR